MNGWWFAFLLLPLLQAPAASPEYLTHTWQVEDGLPQNAVTAILQTRDGYLWLGTYGGLVRFDGVRFKVFNNANTPGLKSSRITSLFEDNASNLWVGHEGGELTCVRGGRFAPAKTPAGWKGGKIIALEDDAASDVWAVNESGLATRVRDGLTLAPPAGSANGQLRVSKSNDGNIWIIRDGRVSLLKGGRILPVAFGGGMDNTFVQGVCAGRENRVWVASEGQLREWQGDRWIKDLGAAPWGYSAVTCMLETRPGALAVGTVDFGLYLITPGGRTLQFDSTNGLPQNWVRSLCEDQEGDLWIGAGSAGLVALHESHVATVAPPDHWQGRAILSVQAARDGAMWVGTEGTGLYRRQNGTWKHFGEADGLANGFVWSISEDAQGQIWAGTWSGGIFVKRGERFERAPGLENLTLPTPALMNTGDGVLWAGTGNGLLRYRRGAATWFGRNEQTPLEIHAVAQAKDGTIWFGTSDGGLGRLKNDEIRQYRRSDGLSSDFVQCLHFDTEGTLWIGTGGGLSRFNHGKFAAITTRQGLVNDVICNIQEDDRGYLWLSSHGGLMRVSKTELNRCADGATNRVNCLAYGRGEGMPTLECSGGGQPTGCKTADGQLWFATSKGLVSVDPDHVKLNNRPPPVVIETLRVNDQPVTMIATNTGAARLQIPPGRQRFEFQYTALSFADPEKVRFKYRLEGLEPDWVNAGAKRQANYSFLPPGDYVFHVVACNNDGVWNRTGAALAFTVLPFFWQTWWFRALAGLAAAAAVGGIVRFETRRRLHQRLEKSERQHAIERERTRIAKDIHDDLGASLTRITMLSQSAREERGGSETATELDRIYDTARELTRAMDEIVWAVNPKHDTLDSLATYLGRFAQDFLASAQVRCRLDLPVHLPPWALTAEVRHNLFLAFKEALNNAVKHAATSEVRISLLLEPPGFALRIEDQGRGFSLADVEAQKLEKTARISSGNGLRNMRHRLDEIGGRCEIHSAPKEGTKVTFVVPVKESATSKD